MCSLLAFSSFSYNSRYKLQRVNYIPRTSLKTSPLHCLKKKFCVINDDYTDLSNHHLLFPVCPPPSVIILFAVVRAKPGPKLNIYRQPLDIHFCQCLPHNFIANLGPTSLEADLAGGPGRALVEKLTRIHSSLPSARFGESTELLHFLLEKKVASILLEVRSLLKN